MRRQYAQDTGRCREAAAHIIRGGITTSALWVSSPNSVVWLSGTSSLCGPEMLRVQTKENLKSQVKSPSLLIPVQYYKGRTAGGRLCWFQKLLQVN